MRRLIRKLLPSVVIKRIDDVKKDLQYRYFGILSRLPFLASVHYGLISSDFRREHHGVATGKYKYFKELYEYKTNRYLLRRNIHRLEKGLLMKPRRDEFAVQYILPTVEAYKVAHFHQGRDEKEIKWAHDVLQAYFQIVLTDNKVVIQAKELFLDVPYVDNDAKKYIPYLRDTSRTPTVSYEALLDLSIRRRSTRWYAQKPVPYDLIEKAIALAIYSPSACNRQPFEFRVYDAPDLIKKIAVLPLGTGGFHHNLPMIIVIVGKLEAYYDERDRHLIYIDSSLAAMSFMYALETLGLSSCPINWADIPAREAKMASLLNLSPDERPIMLISVGYPDEEGLIASSQKRSLDQIRSYNVT